VVEEAVGDEALEGVKSHPETELELAFHIVDHVKEVSRAIVGEAVGISGLMIHVDVTCGDGTRWPFVVDIDSAVDRSRWKRIWKYFGGSKLDLRWSDGSSVEVN
jgi:hypothetical protein